METQVEIYERMTGIKTMQDLLVEYDKHMDSKGGERLYWSENTEGTFYITHRVPWVGEDPERVYAISRDEGAGIIEDFHKTLEWAAERMANSEFPLGEMTEILHEFMFDQLYGHRVNRR